MFTKILTYVLQILPFTFQNIAAFSLFIVALWYQMHIFHRTRVV